MTETRATFVDRLRPVVTPAELIDIELAYMLAKYVHRAQVRMETDPAGEALRYFEHPRRVALILLDTVGVTDAAVICAALLHDVVEDSVELTPAAIERHWGTEVARTVGLLSKAPKDGYAERLLRHGDWRALLVKAADRLDNLRSIDDDEVLPLFRDRQLRETRETYLPIFERLRLIVPRELTSGTEAVLDEIGRILDMPR